jgi:hypothetical protein
MNYSWLIKYILIIVATILKLTAALIQAPHLTELGRILFDAVHCLYCNPGYYPHGTLWYAVVVPLSYFVDSKVVMMEFALIDMALLILLIKHNIFYAYFLVSFVSFFVIPQNIPVYWLMLLGLYSSFFLPFSILAKLPVGAPYAVWHFIFSTSLNIVTNFQDDYGLLVFLWLYIFIYNLRFDLIKGWAKLRK